MVNNSFSFPPRSDGLENNYIGCQSFFEVFIHFSFRDHNTKALLKFRSMHHQGPKQVMVCGSEEGFARCHDKGRFSNFCKKVWKILAPFGNAN